MPESGQSAEEVAPQKPIKVDLPESSLADMASRITEPIHREMTAKWIALLIVCTAGLSLFLVIWRGFRLIELSRNDPETAKLLIANSVIPLIEKVATFFTTVFGPLLAFILGYYFGQRQAQRRTGD